MSKVLSFISIKYFMNALIIIILILGANQIAKKSHRLIFKSNEINNVKIDVPWNNPLPPVVLMFEKNILINDETMHQKLSKNLFTFNLIKRIISISIILLILIHLKKLLLAIKSKTFFELENIGIIKKLSIIVVLWVISNLLLYLSLPFIIPKDIIVESINFVPIGESLFNALMIGVDFKMLFAAIILYVISVLFKEGYQLKRESELTI